MSSPKVRKVGSNTGHAMANGQWEKKMPSVLFKLDTRLDPREVEMFGWQRKRFRQIKCQSSHATESDTFEVSIGSMKSNAESIVRASHVQA